SSTTPLGETTSTTYDISSRPLTVTAPNGVVHANTYNDFGQLQYSIANALGSGTPSGTSGSDNLITAFSYDPQGHLVQTDVDTSGGTSFAGGLDAQTQATYDGQGAQLSSTSYPGFAGAGTARITTNHFATTLTAPAGSIYATPGAPTGVQAPVAPSSGPAPACPDGVGYCNTVASIDQNGLVLATIDAYGHPTTTLYDLAGQPVQITVASDPGTSGHGGGNDRNLSALTSYDLAGRLSSVTDPAGRTTTTGYDNLGRPTLVTRADSTSTPISDQKTVYLASGRVDRVSSTETAGSADGARTWTKTLYDGLGRAVTTLVPYDISGAAGLQLESFE
ncbi:MAG: RHS repeat domain-containing protein, partial [Candidatus Limnocylindrales bacterium]